MINTNPNAANINYNASQRNMEYSKEGQTVAKTTLDYYDKGGMEWQTARKVLSEAFSSIMKNPRTTEDEKALAKMGRDFGDDYMYNDDSARLQATVMSAISSGIPGPVGIVLAKSSDNAYSLGGIQWEAARKIMGEGFNAIIQNPSASDDEKALAKMGRDFGDDYMYNEDAARLQAVVMKAIASSQSGPMAQVLADVSADAYSLGGIQWEAARKILKEGFEAIINNPKSSESDKSMAKLGLEVGNDYMTDQEAAQARIGIMKQIRDQ